MSNPTTLLLTDLKIYPKLIGGLSRLSEQEAIPKLRNLCRTDLYFLLRYACGRADVERPWIFARCREVQANPDGHLDLWAREHYKSTIITFGLTIQEILNNPEITVGIFSHTRPIAKGFLRQIKRELENNDALKRWFPDVLWHDPRKEAPKWSEDEGIVVKRRGNPKEQTVEAWGLVDGQPTSKHYKRMIYDDVVTRESVTTPEMIAKTTEAWELSRNLSSEGGATRYIGTRYHFNDTYKPIMDRGAAVVRLYAATADGTVDGAPVLLSRDRLAEKRREMGPYTFGCQMLQDPKADETQGFKEEWLRFYPGEIDGEGMNKYILADAASSKKKDSDYTAMFVIGLASDQNTYVLEMIRDRLNLKQRGDALFRLHRRWRPLAVGYERYGMMADVEHFKLRMHEESYHFSITELGGPMPKPDRIKRLIPKFEQGRIWLPETHMKTNYEGVTVDLTRAFVEEEFKPFPVALHDDMLDALSRSEDEDITLVWPEAQEYRERYYKRRSPRAGWMAA